MKTRFIVNPESANGSTGRRWPHIELLLKRTYRFNYEVAFTEKPWHASQLAREAIEGGCDRIISVGGDGTLNEVVNGFLENDNLINPDAALGVLEIGTGADFSKSFNFPKTVEEMILRLNRAKPKMIDVGKAEYRSLKDLEITRYFVNILDFGMGGAVVERVNRTTKLFGGKISFLIGILTTLFKYENKTIHYRLDGGEWETGVFNNFITANGRYFGGGLFPAPSAELDDGWFDVVFFGDVGRLEAILNLSKLRKGTHLENPKVTLRRAKEIEAVSKEQVFIDMDGEFVGKLPLKVLIFPKKLPILV
ncbi:diacylglycerol kinase [bacterium BMS3Abin05]|nr:diacylglycerol kinase [bacterium BMS3Abin05]HDZ10939.1 diacylglycerol kinase family lipid kinase [Bacteroidota bacterium]